MQAIKVQQSVGSKVVSKTTPRPAVACSAQPDRRSALLGFMAAGAALVAAPQAQAIKIPSQESTGGQGVGGGNMTKSSTAATADGYTMEGYPGTKKPSWISPKEKRGLLAEAREKAERQSLAQ